MHYPPPPFDSHRTGTNRLKRIHAAYVFGEWDWAKKCVCDWNWGNGKKANKFTKTQSIDTYTNKTQTISIFYTRRMYYSKEQNWVGANRCYRFCWLRFARTVHHSGSSIFASSRLRQTICESKKELPSRKKSNRGNKSRAKTALSVTLPEHATADERTHNLQHFCISVRAKYSQAEVAAKIVGWCSHLEMMRGLAAVIFSSPSSACRTMNESIYI